MYRWMGVTYTGSGSINVRARFGWWDEKREGGRGVSSFFSF